MKKDTYDVVVIGGGPAGMAAACKAAEWTQRVLIIERSSLLGGVLNQCIHTGFGLHYFGKNLTGPEFADLQREKVKKREIDVWTDTFVIRILPNRTIVAVNENGMLQISAKAIVLAMGCRERTRESIVVPGARVAGVYTAGTAQRYMNLENFVPGRQFVILGSGDIGLIMARRLTLEGLEVKGVFEIMPEPNGLRRNIKNCLEDYGIPLHLSTTITKIIGKNRVEAAEVSRVDENGKPIPGTERIIECDTVLMAIGLIPENELTSGAGARLNPVTNGPLVDESCQTTVPGIFACGNVLQVHDLVDNVVAEAEKAGKEAAEYALGEAAAHLQWSGGITVESQGIVRYTVPNAIRSSERPVSLSFRVRKGISGARAVIRSGERILWQGRPRGYKPSVMEQLNMPASVLKQAEGTITLSVEQEDAE